MPALDPPDRFLWRWRFWRYFRREKMPVVDVTQSYLYMMRFPRLPITVPPLVPTLMSYRWNDDDDCDPSPKKFSRNNHHQHVRRRLPKRYSDIVGPSSKGVFARKDIAGTTGEKQPAVATQHVRSSTNAHRRTSLKAVHNEALYIANSQQHREPTAPAPTTQGNPKTRAIVTRRYSSKNKRMSAIGADDLLAHRMQAAMGSELMHSLDRNFVFGDRKQSTQANLVIMNRSHSFNIASPPNDWWRYSHQEHYHLIPRAKHRLGGEKPTSTMTKKSKNKGSSIEEPTPDYDDLDEQQQEIIIRRIRNDDEVGEEPLADYDDPKPTPITEVDEKITTTTTTTTSETRMISYNDIPETFTPTSTESMSCEQTSSEPPNAPPLPIAVVQQEKPVTFRCRTIADAISADHKLILKDQSDTSTDHHRSASKSHAIINMPVIISQLRPSKSSYGHLSKELLEKTNLRRVPHSVTRSYSSYGSMSQLNERETTSTTLRATASILDGSISSPATSFLAEQEYEQQQQQSTSSKIYNDYKRRASLTSVPTSDSCLNGLHSNIIVPIVHPMHTRIGLLSLTSSSSTTDKPCDMTLSSKQMNVCVINQLNEHLSTRFRKQQQQQESCSTNNSNTTKSHTNNCISYDQPPEYMSTNAQTHLYDEPEESEGMNKPIQDPPISSIPPPPPPLPVGGFRPLLPSNRPSYSQRTSVMTLPRESIGPDITCSTGTSTTSSKLSDTRILRELRTNPLFTKAKEHLEVEPGSNGRRSGRRLVGASPQTSESGTHELTSYMRLDTFSKGTSITPIKCDLTFSSRTPSSLTNAQYEPIRNHTTQTSSSAITGETIIMNPAELNAVICSTTKRTKSMNSNTTSDKINRIKTRTHTTSLLASQSCQSELELIFQTKLISQLNCPQINAR